MPDTLPLDTQVIRFHKKLDPNEAVNYLINGEYVLIVDYFSTGLTILNRLKKFLKKKSKTQDFQGQRSYRLAFREASHHLLLEVENNQLKSRKSPEIGWLEILYSNQGSFLMAYPDIQGLNSSWQWYIKGLKIDLLNIEIHPYYGTYFPTRFDHLFLFDTWLQEYKGDKDLAYDIGAGSGVLTFQLLQNGFKKVIATDTNPNVIIGLKEEKARLGYESNIRLFHGDLFADSNKKAEMIVFNPPWLVAKHELQEGIDKAIYYKKNLFPRFFKSAKECLKPNGKLVLLFSNLAQVVGAEENHPILHELETEKRFKKENHIQKEVAPSSKKTRRRNFRTKEKVELWVLTHL